MATQKDKQRERRIQWLARLIAEPMTSEERVSAVQAGIGCSRKSARVTLDRARKVLRKRHEKTADAEGFEQVERLRLLAREARESRDYQAQIAAERLLADVVGTKKVEKTQVEHTGPALALVALARADAKVDR